MRATDIIAAKRDGAALSPEAIRTFVAGVTSGEIPDYQSAALLMAIVLRGMDAAETAALTEAMADSGCRLDLRDLPGAIDKHSTGGVGDKATLVVVPLLAAAGVPVCKMSGRGLGHTGGTVDKLEAIPGFTVGLSPAAMRAQVLRIGACLAGQTADLAPADGALYALRDATATVNSIPLIVASILSKKLAGGAGAFLFDVKAGGGALMPTTDAARSLACALVDGARACGRRARALITDMDAPLGRAVGNALEVAEAIALLDPATGGDADPRLRALCLRLAAEGIALSKGTGIDDAFDAARDALESGRARDRFAQIVAAQGGDARVVTDPGLLPQAPVVAFLNAPRDGFVAGIDARAVGEAVVALGGGRARKEDRIDPSVGVVLRATVGSAVRAGAPLAAVHAATDPAAAAAIERLRNAFLLADDAPAPTPLVRDAIG